MNVELYDHEFTRFCQLIYRIAGISLSDTKKTLVSNRLVKRLRYHGLSSFGEYFQLIDSGRQPEEVQILVDLLTTNETFFFREQAHFDYLKNIVLPEFTHSRNLRVWSAASSTGQEACTVAMVLASGLSKGNWEILASDISTRVLVTARSGQYPLEQAKNIPVRYLKQYCLKGIGPEEGTFLIDRELHRKIEFRQINLNDTLPYLGEFDLVFLRNVMIYFDSRTKREVVLRILQCMRNGAYLFIGHSENLNGVVEGLQLVAPSIYRLQK